MKVAFVEWDTKVPHWQYQGIPSYLLDTTRTIDATAFGANASAVEGSLVGLKYFQEGNAPQALRDYLNSRNVVFLATRYHWREFGELASRLTPFTMLGFGMGLDQLREGMQRPDGLESLMTLMTGVNLVTSFSEALVPYLTLLAPTPVEYLPMAYPYSYVRDHYRIPRTKTILIPGVVWNAELGGRRDDICSLLLGGRLVRERPDYRLKLSDRKVHREESPHASRVPADLQCRVFGWEPPVIETQGSLPWKHFLAWAQGSVLSIHCDWCWTTGRMAADMAAMGIPHLGGNSDHAVHLFPRFCTGEFETDAMESLSERVLDSHSFANDVITEADTWGERLDLPSWKRWFERLVEQYRTGV